ncbi:MAG: VOC family protein [Pseudomonadota bacterium]
MARRPNNRLALITYLARDYDQAVDWFCRVLGFSLIEDTDQGGGKRWVRLGLGDAGGTQLLVAKAVGDQADFVGKHAGTRVGFFLYTNDFDSQYAKMVAMDVHFEESPRQESYGKVAVFQDLYGNRWDLIERA